MSSRRPAESSAAGQKRGLESADAGELEASGPDSKLKRPPVFLPPDLRPRGPAWWRCNRAPAGLERTPQGFIVPDLAVPTWRGGLKNPPLLRIDPEGRWLLVVGGSDGPFGCDSNPTFRIARFGLDAPRDAAAVEFASVNDYVRGASILSDGTAKIVLDGGIAAWATGEAGLRPPCEPPEASFAPIPVPSFSGQQMLGVRGLRVDIEGRSVPIPGAPADGSPQYSVLAHGCPGGWIVALRAASPAIPTCTCACTCGRRTRISNRQWLLSESDYAFREIPALPWPADDPSRSPSSAAVPDGSGGVEWGCRSGIIAWSSTDAGRSASIIPLVGASCAAWTYCRVRGIVARLAFDENEGFWELAVYQGPYSSDPRASRNVICR